jgi:hypothetical protein
MGMRNVLALALLAAWPVSARAGGALAQAARLNLRSGALAVGFQAGAAEPALDCRDSTVQHTIRRCRLKAAEAGVATSLGHPVKNATLNLHFQGDVLNMSLEFERAIGFERLLADCTSAAGFAPKVQYWADDGHLYASYIWVDGDAELELARTIKGADDGSSLRVYLSSLSGGRPLSPQDAR